MKSLKLIPILMTIALITAINWNPAMAEEIIRGGVDYSFTLVHENTLMTKDIDFTRKLKGLVDVLYSDSKTKKVKLIVDLDGNRYIYNILDRDDYESFPLQLGNGNYSLQIYENTSGTKYRKVFSTSGSVYLDDPLIVYLTSMQQVLWTKEDIAIQKAQSLLFDYKMAKFFLKDALMSLRMNLMPLLYQMMK